MKETMQQIRKVLGEIPILASEQRLLDKAEADAQAAEEAAAAASQPNGSSNKPTTKTRVLADGTYATETVYSSNATSKLDSVKNATKPPLRALILGGDYYTATVLAATLTKLVLRFGEQSRDAQSVNSLRAEAMLIMTSIIRVGQSQFVTVPIDEDSQERISTCLQALASFQTKSPEQAEVREIFLVDTQKAYSNMVGHEEKKAKEKRAKDSKASLVQADDPVAFRQFAKKNGGEVDEVRHCWPERMWQILMYHNVQYESALTKATGSLDNDESLLSKLSRVVQLTGEYAMLSRTCRLLMLRCLGFSDPVYAEAYVNVHQFDINLGMSFPT